MAIRKNTKFIDPRYFMNEKMERLDERSPIVGRNPQPEEIAGDLVTAVLSDLRFDRDGEAQGGLGYPLTDLAGDHSLPMRRLKQMIETEKDNPDFVTDSERLMKNVKAEINQLVRRLQENEVVEAYTSIGDTYNLRRTEDSIPQDSAELERKRQSGQNFGPGVVMSGRGW